MAEEFFQLIADPKERDEAREKWRSMGQQRTGATG
jgi:hypothetical protein